MPTTAQRHRTLTAVAAAATLLLAGCAGDPEAGPPPPSLTPRPTLATVTESPEPEPEPETAKEFIRRWPVVETAMVTTGDSTEFLSLSDDNCGYCSTLAARITNIYAQGGFVKTTGWTVSKIRRAPGSEAGDHKYELRSRYEPSSLKEKETGEVQQLDGGVVTQEVTLIKSDAGWLMGESVEKSQGS